MPRMMSKRNRTQHRQDKQSGTRRPYLIASPALWLTVSDVRKPTLSTGEDALPTGLKTGKMDWIFYTGNHYHNISNISNYAAIICMAESYAELWRLILEIRGLNPGLETGFFWWFSSVSREYTKSGPDCIFPSTLQATIYLSLCRILY